MCIKSVESVRMMLSQGRPKQVPSIDSTLPVSLSAAPWPIIANCCLVSEEEGDPLGSRFWVLASGGDFPINSAFRFSELGSSKLSR